MRISDWSSDVCSSDLAIAALARLGDVRVVELALQPAGGRRGAPLGGLHPDLEAAPREVASGRAAPAAPRPATRAFTTAPRPTAPGFRQNAPPQPVASLSREARTEAAAALDATAGTGDAGRE